MEINKIYLGDCLEVMKNIPDKSVDMILCDLPHGTTNCDWDIIIPFPQLWEQYKRIIKENGTIILTGNQPFTSLLVVSNLEMFKYSLVWEKQKATGYLNCNRRPLREHEDILVFGNSQSTYNPQMVKGQPYDKGFRRSNKDKSHSEVYGTFNGSRIFNTNGDRYPRSILRFNTENGLHPTQKPVELFSYLIKTYSKKGGLVLDNCIGSGTTAIACIRTGRKYLGMEKKRKYWEMACKRVEQENRQLKLELE